MSEPIIVRLEQLPTGALAELIVASEAEGFRFVRRLLDEWESGTNCFARPGEALFALYHDTRIIGVCGLNIDPYTTAARIGRVRRLYVLSAFRRQGLGRQLTQAVIRASLGHFDSLRLRTTSEAAAGFYESLGFHACGHLSNTTHVREISR